MRKESLSVGTMVLAVLLLGACGDDGGSKKTASEDGGAKDAGSGGTSDNSGDSDANTGSGAGSTGSMNGGTTGGGTTGGEGSGTTGGGTTGGTTGSTTGGTTGGVKCSSSAESACDFVVTTGMKTSAHPWYNMGHDRGYLIGGVEGKSLTLKRGTAYTFLLKQSCNHPFYLSTAKTGVNVDRVTEGVTSPASACEGAVLTFKPSNSTPPTLYYQCEAHSQMGGTITVSN